MNSEFSSTKEKSSWKKPVVILLFIVVVILLYFAWSCYTSKLSDRVAWKVSFVPPPSDTVVTLPRPGQFRDYTITSVKPSNGSPALPLDNITEYMGHYEITLPSGTSAGQKLTYDFTLNNLVKGGTNEIVTNTQRKLV